MAHNSEGGHLKHFAGQKQGCLDVFLKVLPTENDELRELCSLATRCLAGHEELLLELLTEPRSVGL